MRPGRGRGLRDQGSVEVAVVFNWVDRSVGVGRDGHLGLFLLGRRVGRGEGNGVVQRRGGSGVGALMAGRVGRGVGNLIGRHHVVANKVVRVRVQVRVLVGRRVGGEVVWTGALGVVALVVIGGINIVT